MTLHEDKNLFVKLITDTATAQGIDIRYVEKDYWIRQQKHLNI